MNATYASNEMKTELDDLKIKIVSDKKVKYKNIQIQNSIFDYSYIDNLELNNMKFHNTSIQQFTFRMCNIDNSEFTSINLTGSVFQNVIFRESTFHNVDFSKALELCYSNVLFFIYFKNSKQWKESMFMIVQDWLGRDNIIGIDIWEKKYRQNNASFEEWLDRVSNNNKEVRNLIVQKKFLFGGRILFNNLHSKVTYSNCYVLTPPEDSIESIFECASKMARTFSYGGGVGVDISKLAPRGTKVHNAAKQTSGAVSFMDLYSHVTGLIGQNDRRGALMLSIDCDHPDIEEFIKIKSDLNRVTKVNISIKVTRKFMEAVIEDKLLLLSFTRKETGKTICKTVQARELFHTIAEMN